MDAHIECACCHRHERWTPTDQGVRHEVLVEGGVRRPPGDPRRMRANTAIRCVEDPRCHVVGDCPVCGQLLVSDLPDVPSVPVVVDTPKGSLRIADGVILGPTGALTTAEARRLVDDAWAYEDQVSGSQLAKAPLLAPVFVVIGAWLLGLAFVWVFLASLAQGPTPS